MYKDQLDNLSAFTSAFVSSIAGKIAGECLLAPAGITANPKHRSGQVDLPKNVTTT